MGASAGSSRRDVLTRYTRARVRLVVVRIVALIALFSLLLQEVNVQALLAREKADRDDMDAVFARNIVRLGTNYKGSVCSASFFFVRLPTCLVGARWLMITRSFVPRQQELSAGHSTGMDEEDQIDTRLYEQADERMTSQRAMEMQVKRSINEERRHRERIQNCRQCMVCVAMVAVVCLHCCRA